MSNWEINSDHLAIMGLSKPALVINTLIGLVSPREWVDQTRPNLPGWASTGERKREEEKRGG